MNRVLLLLKGIAMGAADVVPGVSGGTIAFITGIYQELLDSIKNFPKSLKPLFKGRFKQFWKEANLNFLLFLFAGIGISILSLAKLLKHLLETHPILVWSFFFGLIIASAIFVGKTIPNWNISKVFTAILGAAIAFGITVITPAQTSEAYWFVFLTGMVAISAMILPGISGSFILLLFGKYEFIINALTNMKIDVIGVFVGGIVVGLLLFSNILSWMLKKFHDLTLALLTGFMIGSLNKVWPWKQTVETFIDRHGEAKPLVEKNVLPDAFEQLTAQSSQLYYAIALMLLGFAIIFVIEMIASKLSKSNSGS